MTDNRLNLNCLIDSDPISKAFLLTITSIETVGELKQLIKTENAVNFMDVDAGSLTLWRVSIPDDDSLDDKTELNNPRTRLSKLFSESPDDNTYIIVQPPPPVHTPVLSDYSRPSTLLS
ncbi:hypothetical protein BGZ58_002786 [Dissophora ornata]|nr:hypothetical protein BGZ58_002786 [Dissophora ornata]